MNRVTIQCRSSQVFFFCFLSIQHETNDRCLSKRAPLVLFAPTKCLHKAPSHLWAIRLRTVRFSPPLTTLISGQWKRQLSKHGARGPLSVGAAGAFSPVKSRKFKQVAAEVQELEGRWSVSPCLSSTGQLVLVSILRGNKSYFSPLLKSLNSKSVVLWCRSLSITQRLAERNRRDEWNMWHGCQSAAGSIFRGWVVDTLWDR